MHFLYLYAAFKYLMMYVQCILITDISAWDPCNKKISQWFNDKKKEGIRHMVKGHSDSKKGNPLPPHRLLFSINSKGFLYAPSHIPQPLLHEGSIRRPITP